MRRAIIQMGMGHSTTSPTQAASRAIEDALARARLSLLDALGLPQERLHLHVTLAAQTPEGVDCTRLKALLGSGHVTITPVFGGLDVTDPDTGASTHVVQAAIEAFLPKQA